MKRDLNRTLTRAQVACLLETARAFDLDRGGPYDARGGAVNLWATVEDHPAALGHLLLRGGDALPEVVGTLWWDWLTDDAARLRVEASPYALLSEARRALRAARGHFATPRHFQERLRAPLTAEQEESCLGWCEAKARELLRLAELTFAPAPGR